MIGDAASRSSRPVRANAAVSSLPTRCSSGGGRSPGRFRSVPLAGAQSQAAVQESWPSRARRDSMPALGKLLARGRLCRGGHAPRGADRVRVSELRVRLTPPACQDQASSHADGLDDDERLQQRVQPGESRISPTAASSGGPPPPPRFDRGCVRFDPICDAPNRRVCGTAPTFRRWRRIRQQPVPMMRPRSRREPATPTTAASTPRRPRAPCAARSKSRPRSC